MREYFNVLKNVFLFDGIGTSELESMLRCLGAQVKRASKGAFLLLAGDRPRHVGIVLSGQLHISRDDIGGARSLLAAVNEGGIFAEALCCAGVIESPVTVTADTDSTVMLLEFSRILHTCPSSCDFHTKLIENMLGIIANKNLQLQSRMELASMKSVRAKVWRYLEAFTAERGREITIPFNREELADYLCVERSALSHELARMKRDGFIDYKKNKFIIKAAIGESAL